MTEHHVVAPPEGDATQRLTSLRVPMTHDEMAAAVASRGSVFTLEMWLVQAKSYAGSILGVGVLSPLLYLMAMGVGLGVVVDKASGGGLGVPYLHFVAPALLLTTAMQAATEENTFTIMGGFKWRETYYAPQVTPIEPEQIAGGHVLGVTLRYLVTCIIYWAVLAVFGAIPHLLTGLLLIPIGVLCASAVGLPIMAWSSTITQDKGQFALLGRFVIMPMMLFAGTYFPLETLPIYLRPLGWVSPLWHAVELGRAVTIGAPTTAMMVVVHLGYMSALCVIGWVLARRHYRRRLVG
ncbi:MAG: ABC transporter permease [Propionibacteriaceae bacterium]|nr:ABC transporter permease [Propionibacteriaceae bacterium]